MQPNVHIVTQWVPQDGRHKMAVLSYRDDIRVDAFLYEWAEVIVDREEAQRSL